MSYLVSTNTTAMKILRTLAVLGVLVSLIWPAHAAHAEVTTRDLQILARTLGFLDPPLSGEVKVGIAFDAGSTRSSNEAKNISSLMGDGLTVGNLVLKPALVPFAQAASADVRLFLLAETSGDGAQMLRAVAQDRQLPCLTTDLEQVRAGNCAVGMQSSPKVEILVNRDTASASGVSFASVFRMMIKEL